jgi:hypothetical protein
MIFRVSVHELVAPHLVEEAGVFQLSGELVPGQNPK